MNDIDTQLLLLAIEDLNSLLLHLELLRKLGIEMAHYHYSPFNLLGEELTEILRIRRRTL